MQLLQELLASTNSHIVENLAFGQALEGSPTHEWIYLQEVLHDVCDLLRSWREFLRHHISSFLYGRDPLHLAGIRSIERLLKFPHIVDSMLACQEAQVGFALESEVLQDDQILIILTDHVHFVFIAVVRILLLVLVVIILVTWREWEAGIALVQVTYALELFAEICLAAIVLQVLNELVNDAAQTPKI